MDINKAVEFIIDKHKGQKRIGGKDYHSHPIAVAELISSKGLSQDMIVTALFGLSTLLKVASAKHYHTGNLSCLKI